MSNKSNVFFYYSNKTWNGHFMRQQHNLFFTDWPVRRIVRPARSGIHEPVRDIRRPNVIIPPPGKLSHAALYLIGSGACFLFMLLVADIAGTEALSLYLHSSYRAYPIILLGLPCATGLLCLAMAALSARAAFRGGDARPHPPVQVTAALLLCACVAVAGMFLRQQARRYAGPPSAPKKLQEPIGPFAHFGPFAGRRADGSTSMVVWYFDPAKAAAPAEIEYGPDYPAAPATRMREVPGGDGRRHEFRLTGLAPGTRYRYRLPRPDAAWRAFSTAPGRGMPLRFLCLADTGPPLAGSAVTYYGEVTRAAADWYRAIGVMPVFMVHGGDAVRTGADLDGWRAAFGANALAGLLPVVAAPGNHELLEDGGANFRYTCTARRITAQSTAATAASLSCTPTTARAGLSTARSSAQARNSTDGPRASSRGSGTGNGSSW